MLVSITSTLARSVVKKVAATSTVSAGFHSSSSVAAKVAVLGATGGIGQPLSLLCKLSGEIDELACYDVVGTPGVAADLSHIPTRATTSGYLPSVGTWPPSCNEGLKAALTGADVVIIPAGVPRKPGMTRDDLFQTNASIVKTLVEGCAEFCPDAVLAIISNPVNSTVPIAAEVLKKAGVYNPAKLCGVTTLDVCRANTFVGTHMGKDPKDVDVTVIGGHAGITILPLFSQVEGGNFTDEELETITVRTQFGGDEVVQAKAGAGSATLSMAYAGYIFAENVLKAQRGEKNVIQCAFVQSDITDAPFFASPCRFGPNGVEEIMGYGTLTPYEQAWFDKMIPDLKKQIQKGVDFVKV
jgi:malate dehydrogenase